VCSVASTKISCSVTCSSQCALSLEKHSVPLQRSKSEVHPRTCYEDPEAEYIYSCTLSLTSDLDGGGWSTPSTTTLLPGRNLFAFYRTLGGPPRPFCVLKFGGGGGEELYFINSSR